MKILISLFMMFNIAFAYSKQLDKITLGKLYITPSKTQNILKLVHQNIVYISGKYGLFIVDTSDAKKPKIVNKISFDKLDYIQEIAINQNDLYILLDNKLLLYNISNPIKPVYVNSIKLKGNFYSLHIFAKQKKVLIRSKIDKSYYVVDNNLKIENKLDNSDLFGISKVVYESDLAFSIFDRGFNIIDVSKVLKPKLIKWVPVITKQNAEIVVSDLLLSKNVQYCYVINGDNGLQIFDISNKKNIIKLGKLDFGSDNMLSFGFLDEDTIYGMLDDQLVLIDIKNKSNPKITMSIKGLGNIGYILPYNKKIVAATDNLESNNYIYVIDIKDKNKYKIKQKIDVKDEIFDIKIKKNLLYLYGKHGLAIQELFIGK